jgi:ribosomal protein S4
MSDFLLIEAAGGGKPKVKGLAYSGGKMNLPGWKHPVVVELAGMEIPDNVPLLTNHQNKTTSRVGMVMATVKDNSLEIDGEIISENGDAKDIVAQGKSGADWQLSIGADVVKCEFVKAGSREVNGKMCDAPFYHVKQSVLREVSVVAVGADSSTKMKVTASFNLNSNQGGDMPEDNKQEVQDKETPEMNTEEQTETTEQEQEIQEQPKDEAEAVATPPTIQASAQETAQDAIKAERKRVSEIQAICDGEYPEIEREAISKGWEPETVTAKVLKMIRAERPSADVNISIKSKPEGNEMRKTLEAAMSLRVGLSADELEKSYGGKVVEAGMTEMDMPLRQMLVECMKLDGIPVPRGFDNDSIRAAFSTVSLPGILSNVAHKKLLQSFKAQPVIATKLCSSGDLNDFKENDRFRLTDVGDLLPVAADGEIKDGGLVEETAKNQLDTYGKKFCLTRKMIINDDLGAFMKVPTAMGNRAARLIDQLFFSRLLSNPVQSDNKALFHTAHKNLISGATSALGSDSLKKAIQLFLDQVDADGQPISVEPKYLLVPTALKHLAIELTQGATLVMSGGNDNTVRPAINVIADENLQVVSSPYLGNAAYTGSSQTGWYLWGNPQTVDSWEIGYLKGKRTPTVERGDTDFNTLGMWFRVYFDLGVREQDHRGMVKANGAA